MSTKNIGIREEVYERLKAHKRGDESFSEALDRLLREVDSDWRTHVGFLEGEAGDEFEAAVKGGLSELDESLNEMGDEIDEAFGKDP
jgi:predicted CopG family antitoxin